MGDIALPNVNYEADKEKQIPSLPNINFQQDLERLKQEVYNEGLQVEEEGMTDIIRKKTKLPNSNSENLNHRNRNDPTLVSFSNQMLPCICITPRTFNAPI